MRLKHLAVGAIVVAGVAWFAMPGASSASTTKSAIPRYQHIVEITPATRPPACGR